MQKFVVKKISRSTNITIGTEESLMRCCDVKPQKSEDLEVSSVKMCGYLKKKRNVSFSCHRRISTNLFWESIIRVTVAES